MKKVLAKYIVARVDEPVDRGDIFVCGSKGSGKTNKVEQLAQEHYNKGWKVIVLDIERRENVFFGFEENDPMLVQKLHNIGKNPRKYQHEVFVPLMHQGEKEEDNTLLIPETWHPFKIDFNEFSVDDFLVLIPNASGIAKEMMRTMFKAENINSMEDVVGLLYQVISKEREFVMNYGGKTIDVGSSITFKGLSRQVSDLYSSNLIALPSYKGIRLNLGKIIKDKKTITSFTVYNLKEAKYKWVVLRHVIKEIIDFCKKGAHPNLCLVVPEFHRYAPAKESLNPYAFGSTGSLGLMQYILTEGRDAGIKLLADSQNMKQVDAITASNFSVFYVGRQQLQQLKYIASDIIKIPQLRDTGYDAISNIAFAHTGYWCKLWDGGRGWRVAMMTSPSRSFHKRASMRVWDKYEEEGIPFKKVLDVFSPNISYSFDSLSGNTKSKKEESDDYGYV